MLTNFLTAVMLVSLFQVGMSDKPIAPPNPQVQKQHESCPLEKGLAISLEIDGEDTEFLVADVFEYKKETYVVLLGNDGGTILKWQDGLVNLGSEKEFMEVVEYYKSLMVI